MRKQLKGRKGGASDARMFAVVTTRPNQKGRFYRLPTPKDLEAAQKAARDLEKKKQAHTGPLSLVPDEEISLNEIRRISVPIYGMTTWGDLFTPRQALALTTLLEKIKAQSVGTPYETGSGLSQAMAALMTMALGRQTDSLSSLVTWTPGGEFQGHTYQRQALPLVTDFAEVNPWADASGNWLGAIEWIARVLEREAASGAPCWSGWDRLCYGACAAR